MKERAKKYHQALLSREGKFAYDYLTDRGLTNDTIVEWQLGYADSTDREFADRVVFPIYHKKEVIGFTGRSLEEDVQEQKYKHSAGYKKSEVLYGLDQARRHIQSSNHIIIVEGHMDVLLAHQAGHKNVVAICGTDFSPTQLSLIAKTKTIVLALDRDEAGHKATKRHRDWLIENGRKVKHLILPIGVKDIAEAIVKGDTEFIKQPVEYIEYIKDKWSDKDFSIVQNKKDFVAELTPVLQDMTKGEAEDQIEQIAKIADIDKRAIKEELEKKWEDEDGNNKIPLAMLVENTIRKMLERNGRKIVHSGGGDYILVEKKDDDWRSVKDTNVIIGEHGMIDLSHLHNDVRDKINKETTSRDISYKLVEEKMRAIATKNKHEHNIDYFWKRDRYFSYFGDIDTKGWTQEMCVEKIIQAYKLNKRPPHSKERNMKIWGQWLKAPFLMLLRPGTDLPWQPIVEGRNQGIGKSRSIKELAMDDDLFVDNVTYEMMTGADGDKKTMEVVEDAVFVELSDQNDRDRRAYKNFITRTKLKARKAYGRGTSVYKISHVSIETTNSYNTNDTTGQRRDFLFETLATKDNRINVKEIRRVYKIFGALVIPEIKKEIARIDKEAIKNGEKPNYESILSLGDFDNDKIEVERIARKPYIVYMDEVLSNENGDNKNNYIWQHEAILYLKRRMGRDYRKSMWDDIVLHFNLIKRSATRVPVRYTDKNGVLIEAETKDAQRAVFHCEGVGGGGNKDNALIDFVLTSREKDTLPLLKDINFETPKEQSPEDMLEKTMDILDKKENNTDNSYDQQCSQCEGFVATLAASGMCGACDEKVLKG